MLYINTQWIIGRKVIEGSWTIGNFSTYIAIFTAMEFKASKVAKLFNSVQKSQVPWKRIKPYLTEHKIKDKYSNINKGGVTLSVENLSFEGKAGEITGVTGSVASGKSTLGLSL